MAKDKKQQPKKGLTDKELAAKYDTGGKVDFEKAVKKAHSTKTKK